MCKQFLALFIIFSGCLLARPSIVIYSIKNTGKLYETIDSKVITSKVVNSFVNSGQFEVIEHEKMPVIIKNNVPQTGDMDAQFLQSLRADFICFGSFQYSVKKSSKYFGYLRQYKHYLEASVTLQLRVVSVHTGKIVAIEEQIGQGATHLKSKSTVVAIPARLGTYACNKAVKKTVPVLVSRASAYTPLKKSSYSSNSDHHGQTTVVEQKKRFVTVVANGYGVNYKQARSNAIEKAFEVAIEKVAGNESEKKIFFSNKKHFTRNLNSYISRYKVLEEGEYFHSQRVAVKVMVKCEVAWENVVNILQKIRSQLKERHYPRLLIVLNTNSEKLPDGLRTNFNKDTIQIGVESIFRKAGFTVKEMRQVEKLHKREIALAAQEDDINRLTAIGKEFKSELILQFDFQAELIKNNMYDTGASVYNCVTVVQGRILKVDTGEYVSSVSKSYNFSGLNSKLAVHGAFSKSGEKFAHEMIQAILEQSWDFEQDEGKTVEITISGIAYKQVRKLKKSLRHNPVIKQLNQRSFNDSVWRIEVNTSISSDEILDLVFYLGENEDMEFDVKENTSNTIVLTLDNTW